MGNERPIWKALQNLLDHQPAQLSALVTEALRESLVALHQKFPNLSTQGLLDASRSELHQLLWADLKRLQTLRNQVVHENYTPNKTDIDHTVSTLRALIGFLRGPGNDQPASQRLHWREFQKVANEFFAKHLNIKLVPEVELSLQDGSRHRFDFASAGGEVLIECKSYCWTAGGNAPAAKLAHAKLDAQNLKITSAKHKILVFDDDIHPSNGKSLAAYFVHRNENWLGDIEVWRRFDGLFEQIRSQMC